MAYAYYNPTYIATSTNTRWSMSTNRHVAQCNHKKKKVPYSVRKAISSSTIFRYPRFGCDSCSESIISNIVNYILRLPRSERIVYAVEEKLKTLELRALSEKKREEEIYRILVSFALRET